jgi:hypothetical protein
MPGYKMKYGTGGSKRPNKMPSYKRGGQPSLLTKISRAPKKKKGMKGCGCGGQV